MPRARITDWYVYEDSGLTILDRVLGHDGVKLTQAAISTIVYTVYDVTAAAAVVGHNAAALTVSAVIFDTLQVDAIWSDVMGGTDTTGYNFRHALAASAIPTGDRVFRYEAKITPVSGAAIHIVRNLKVLGLYAS